MSSGVSHTDTAMRCFAGCFLEPRSALGLEAALPALGGARPTPRVNYHLTLLFLGELDTAGAERARLAVGALEGAPIECTIAGLDGFPNAKRARVVIARIVEQQELRAWREQLREALGDGEPEALGTEALGTEALGTEALGFEPHVTVARSPRPMRVPEAPGLAGLRLRLRAPALYLSLVDGSGSRYVRFVRAMSR